MALPRFTNENEPWDPRNGLYNLLEVVLNNEIKTNILFTCDEEVFRKKGNFFFGVQHIKWKW